MYGDNKTNSSTKKYFSFGTVKCVLKINLLLEDEKKMTISRPLLHQNRTIAALRIL